MQAQLLSTSPAGSTNLCAMVDVPVGQGHRPELKVAIHEAIEAQELMGTRGAMENFPVCTYSLMLAPRTSYFPDK